MKRTPVIALTVALCFILKFIPPVKAVNAANVQTALPISIAGVVPNGYTGTGKVIPYKPTFDTTATDLTIRTPASGNLVCIVGWFMSETSATNITLTSGSTAYPNIELAANQGLAIPIGKPVFCTQPSEALKMQVSVAVTGMTLYVIEAKSVTITP